MKHDSVNRTACAKSSYSVLASRSRQVKTKARPRPTLLSLLMLMLMLMRSMLVHSPHWHTALLLLRFQEHSCSFSQTRLSAQEATRRVGSCTVRLPLLQCSSSSAPTDGGSGISPRHRLTGTARYLVAESCAPANPGPALTRSLLGHSRSECSCARNTLQFR
ncbi:hypothetical protein BDZ45DRAFT_671309 [Acephala macrosclerotiorum]|nr:hypothetical protein BDZ45DRAFT_671309 [Acephala macrosclerotiorum]